MAATRPPQESKAKWLDGDAVLDLLATCANANLALAALDHALSTGRARAKPTLVNYPRPGGKIEHAASIEPLSPSDWARAKKRKSMTSVLMARRLNLPATGHERAVQIEGLRFEAEKVLEIAAEHGAIQPDKNPGGATSRAHGAVAARLTLQLMQQRDERPRYFETLTGVSLVPQVEKLYQEEQPHRGKPCPKNAERLANGVLSVLRPARNELQFS